MNNESCRISRDIVHYIHDNLHYSPLSPNHHQTESEAWLKIHSPVTHTVRYLVFLDVFSELYNGE